MFKAFRLRGFEARIFYCWCKFLWLFNGLRFSLDGRAKLGLDAMYRLATSLSSADITSFSLIMFVMNIIFYCVHVNYCQAHEQVAVFLLPGEERNHRGSAGSFGGHAGFRAPHTS